MSMVSLGGSDWLGLGSAFTSMSQGTAMCGSKPISGDKTAYETCINRSLEVMAQDNALKAQTEQSKQRTKMIVIGLVSVSIVILAIVLLRRRRK